MSLLSGPHGHEVTDDYMHPGWNVPQTIVVVGIVGALVAGLMALSDLRGKEKDTDVHPDVLPSTYKSGYTPGQSTQ